MLATISPSSQFVEETLSTLRYACQARNIVNTVRINESPNEKRIRELLEEIQRLKDGIDTNDHAECLKKFKTLQAQFDQTTEDLARANVVCTHSEMEIEKLKHELAKEKELANHDDCDRKISELKKDLEECKHWNTDCDQEINNLKRSLCESNEKNFSKEKQINELELQIYDINKNNFNFEEEIFRLETEVREFKELTKQLKSEMNKLNQDLVESRAKNRSYERDISHMKSSIVDIKNNSSHDHCDNQILMLQTALSEAERFGVQFKETIRSLERKCSDTMKTSNHDGCEKEISVLKETISELKKLGDHTKCEKVIEKLKTALTEAENLVIDLESNINRLREEKESLQIDSEQKQEEIISLKNALNDAENTNKHAECDERISTLKKALDLSKSLNTHHQCENRILELEVEVRNLQSVTLTDHTHCDEKNNNLFFAIEKYADENNKLIEGHKAEVLQYKETIKDLEGQISKQSTIIRDGNETSKNSIKDLMHLENQMRTLKEENSRLKQKKVVDEKKVSSLEQQVTSLTKDLLNVKNQLRIAVREKESSDSLCGQLQEQMTQQDRKLALPQSSRQLFVDDDDKENWETPSKVIRRSIAQHSNSNNANERCSLVVKVEEIHQSLKDAEEICSRLKIPWVFQIEPEVTTHSWFDVNIRVWDQRNMSSVRWPREVFLGWLRDMKEEIMSKSRGHKLFHSSPWLQKSRDPELLVSESEQKKKRQPLPEEVESLRSQIVALESLCEPNNKQEVVCAVTALGRAVTQLSHKLGLSSPLRPSDTNTFT